MRLFCAALVCLFCVLGATVLESENIDGALARVSAFYDRQLVQQAVASSGREAVLSSRLFPFKLLYGELAEQVKPLEFIKRFLWMFGGANSVIDGMKFVTCYLAVPNLFRKRYGRFTGRSMSWSGVLVVCNHTNGWGLEKKHVFLLAT